MKHASRTAAAVFTTLGATLGACGTSEPPRLPDVFLISIDTLRADHLGCYGYPVDTSPHLDEFARGAVRWEVARATAPWTLPSHASMFTGLQTFEHGAHTVRTEAPGNNVVPLAERHVTLAELLSSEGYRTRALVANHTYLSKRWGLDQGFDLWQVKRGRAEQLHELLFPWLARLGGAPQFVFLNYMDTHRPYHSEERPGLLPRSVGADSPELIDALTPAVAAGQLAAEDEARMQALRDEYDTAIAHVDEALGALFEELRRHDRWDDALIIVTSDHGEFFGEHDLLEHSKDVYEEVLRVPLLIKFPGQREGRVQPEPVSLAELPGLVVGALPEPARGRLAAQLPAPSAGAGLAAGNYYSRSKDLFDSPWGDRFVRVRHVIYDGPWKFVASSDGADELYHLERDPAELENLVLDEPERAAALRKRVEAMLRASGTEKELGLPPELDEAERQALRDLGYY